MPTSDTLGQANNFGIWYFDTTKILLNVFRMFDVRLPPHLAEALTRENPCAGGSGRGIVIVGGGRYLPSAFIALSHLRRVGCRLPAQLWYLGDDELAPCWSRLARHLDVTAVDAKSVPGAEDFEHLGGWECKVHAIFGCSFEQVLLIDADNIPLTDPGFVFDSPQFARYGQMFWPDFLYTPGHQYAVRQRAWTDLGISGAAGIELESGQIAIDRRRCWRQLQVCRALNLHS